MRVVTNPTTFRENIRKLLFKHIKAEKICINLEKGIFNKTIEVADENNIIKKWDNKFFTTLYENRLRSIMINLKTNPDLIELITFRIGEIDEAELDAEDDYHICNKIEIIDEQNEKNNSLLDLEFDDSGLENKLFIIHTDGNWGYKIIYQNEEWIQ